MEEREPIDRSRPRPDKLRGDQGTSCAAFWGHPHAALTVGPGVYFLRVRGPSFHELRKVVLIR